MNLVIKSPNNFTIIDGKLTSKVKFELIKKGDDLFVGSGTDNQNIVFSGNNINMSNSRNTTGQLFGSTSIGMCGDFKNIHINQKQISFNGYTFDFKDGHLYINGNKYLDEKKESISKEDTMKENEYFEYPLEKDSINSINIEQSSNISIDDLSVLSESNLNILINGSGLVETAFSGYFIKNLSVNINGSGEININKLQSDICNCFITGSGDIYLRESNFNNLNLSITGSGDIQGIRATAAKVSKNIFGSGEINGF